MLFRLFVSGLAITSLLSILYSLDSQYIRYINSKTTDLIRLFGIKQKISSKIIIVDIDEESLLQFGQWPWPRYKVAELLKIIAGGKPRQVGVNIIFAEEDRNSPEVWQQNLRRDFGQHVDLTHLPDYMKNYDHALAQVLRSGPFVLGYAFIFGNQQDSAQCDIPSIPFAEQAPAANPATDMFYEPQALVCSRDVIGKAAGDAGFLNGSADSDGILRRLPLVMKYDGKLYPSFSLAMVLQGAADIRKNGFTLQENRLFVPSMVSGQRSFPLDANGNFLLGQIDPADDLRVSAAQVLAGKVTPRVFEDSIVLVGTGAAGLTKSYSTPFASRVDELDLHAQFIKSLLVELPTVRADYFVACEIITGFVLLFLLVVFSMRTTAPRAAFSCLAGITVSWLAAIFTYRSFGLLFSPLLPGAVVLINCCTLTSIRFYFYQREARSEAGDALLLLKSSETTLHSVLRAIPDIVFRLDQNGRFVFISPAICRYVNNPESLLGRSVFALVVPEDVERARGRINERRTGERATADLEIRLLFPGQDPLRDDLRFFRVRAEGLYRENRTGEEEFLGTQGIIRDITDQKKLEDQLLRAQKMEAIGNMAAGIAHDLNNILSGLVSYPELLLHEVPEDDPVHKKIAVIHKSGKMAAAIVQDMLFLARQGMDVDKVCSVNDVIGEYLQSAGYKRLSERHDTCVIDADLRDALPNIEGSPVHLTKVFMNLVHNGLEAMPAGGRLVIRTDSLELEDDYFGFEPIPPGKYVCVSVEDNGVGMPPASVKHIFEPFYSKKSLGKSGTGLGMTVILATIKDHHGYIDVESQEGVGTKISVYLPVTEKQHAAAGKRYVLEDFVGNECILVVDDVPEQLEIASNILSKLGYTVLRAQSGEEAVEIYREQHVDLVILDMIMPGGMDGLETFESLQKLDAQVRAIITSGHSESQRVTRLMALGASEYVQKPYTLEHLGLAVRAALEGKTE